MQLQGDEADTLGFDLLGLILNFSPHPSCPLATLAALRTTFVTWPLPMLYPLPETPFLPYY